MNRLIKIIFILSLNIFCNAGAEDLGCEQKKSVTRLDTLEYTICLIKKKENKKALGLQYLIKNISSASIRIFVEKSNSYRLWFSIWDAHQVVFQYDEDIWDNDTYIPRPRVYEIKELKPGETHTDQLFFKDLLKIVKSDSPKINLNKQFRLAFFISPNFLRIDESGNAFEAMMFRKKESQSRSIPETTRLGYSDVLIEWE